MATTDPTHVFCIFYLPIAVLATGGAAASLVALLLEIETAKRIKAFGNWRPISAKPSHVT